MIWGCDGSLSHSEYHQKFLKTEIEKVTVKVESKNNDIKSSYIDKCNRNLFLFFLIILKLVGSIKNVDVISILWKMKNRYLLDTDESSVMTN